MRKWAFMPAGANAPRSWPSSPRRKRQAEEKKHGLYRRLHHPGRAGEEGRLSRACEGGGRDFHRAWRAKRVECWGDDVPHGKATDFYRAVAAEEGEGLIFSWIVWPSREAREAGNVKVMADPRMQPSADMPFDMKRLIFGGFEVLVDTGEKV